MTKEAYEHIAAGIEDATAYLKGDKSRGRAHHIDVEMIDIAAARKKLGMSQNVFAETFGFSVGTLRNWEQGHRRPHGPTRILLKVIDKEPEAVKRVLAEA
jgi:putative transcriptional regulator